MQNDSLQLFDALIAPIGKRKNRSERLLKSPFGDDPDWYFMLPPCFNSSLDIHLTERKKNKSSELVWTQGSAFAFQEGESLYPKCKVYETTWGEALEGMDFFLQITRGEVAEPEGTNNKRKPGSVVFRKIVVDQTTKQVIPEIAQDEMTQDEFVYFLITGIHPRNK